MNKYQLILVTFLMSLSVTVLADNSGFQLVSNSEYQAQISFKRPYVKTRGIVSKYNPKILVNQPSISGVVSSPTNIEISFEATDGAEIEIESLEVLYGWLGLNITDRIKEHAQLSKLGLSASNVTLPEGDHTIKIVIKDCQG